MRLRVSELVRRRGRGTEGRAKQQLLRLVRERGLVAREAFEEAVAGEGLEYLLT